MEEEKEKEKSAEPWVGRRILGVAAAGAFAVAAGAFFLLSSAGDSSTDKEDDQPAEDTSRPRKTMKGPDSGGERISRDKFEEETADYFRTRRHNGAKAAVDKFQ